MKILVSRFSRSFLVLSLCALLIPGTVVFAPSDAQAFGSLTENGTAAFMGIGITPTKILHVSGTGPGTVPLFQRGVDSAGFIIERTPTNRWVFGVNENPDLGKGFVISYFPSGAGSSIPKLLVDQWGNVGIGTKDPHSWKLNVKGDSYGGIYASSTGGNAGYFDGDVRVANRLDVGPSPGVSYGRIYLPGAGEIQGVYPSWMSLYWDDYANEIRISNTSSDWCDYWWRTQKGTAIAGNSGSIAPGVTDVTIISGIDTNDYGIEVHFGQADGTDGWCSVWLQHVANKLVGHYIKY